MNTGLTAQAEVHVRVADLLFTYARAVDLGDVSLLHDLLTDDVQLTRADGVREGPDAFIEVYQAVADAGPADSRRHVVTNIRVDQSRGDLLRVEAYFQATFFEQDATRVIYGRYDDDLRQVDGKLRFAHKRNIVERTLVLPAAAAP